MRSPFHVKALFLVAAIIIMILSILLLFLVPLFLIIDQLLRLVGYKLSLDQDEVYEALSDTEWKTGLELKAEIRRQRLESQPYPLIINDIYHILAQLEDEGLVEARVRIHDEAQKNLYGGYSRHEFRRKAYRKRIKKSKRKWFELPTLTPIPEGV